MTDLDTLPESEHFSLEQIGDGIYAAIAREGKGARANAGIVNLGDSALIFDTFMTPQAAKDLLTAAERLCGVPLKYVVNSHRHGDHVLGNIVFPDNVVIISTSVTRHKMIKKVPEAIRSLRQQKSQLDQNNRAAQDRLNDAQDEDERTAILDEMRSCQIMLDAIPQLKPRLPNWTFEQQLVLHGTKRDVELLTFGGGHTESDAIMLLEKEAVVFAADLLFKDTHPWTGDGDLDQWALYIKEIEGLKPKVIVPGHGPLAKKRDFAGFKRYLKMLTKTAEKLLAEDNLEAAIEAAEVPEAFSQLTRPERFQRNLVALCKKLAQ